MLILWRSTAHSVSYINTVFLLVLIKCVALYTRFIWNGCNTYLTDSTLIIPFALSRPNSSLQLSTIMSEEEHFLGSVRDLAGGATHLREVKLPPAFRWVSGSKTSPALVGILRLGPIKEAGTYLMQYLWLKPWHSVDEQCGKAHNLLSVDIKCFCFYFYSSLGAGHASDANI